MQSKTPIYKLFFFEDAIFQRFRNSRYKFIISQMQARFTGLHKPLHICIGWYNKRNEEIPTMFMRNGLYSSFQLSSVGCCFFAKCISTRKEHNIPIPTPKATISQK